MSNDYIEHYGTKRHSGRYPYGSGEDPYQHEGWSWLARDKKLKEQGFTEKERATMLGCENTSDYRNVKSRYVNEVKAGQISRAKYLVNEKKNTPAKAAEIMGIPLSTLKSYLEPDRENRVNLTQHTAELIKEQVNKDKYVDVGRGTNINLGVTPERLKKAISQLENEGYKVQYVQINQMGTNHKTSIKVLTKDDVDYNTLKDNKYKISTLGGNKIVDENGEIVSTKTEPLKSISSKRIAIRYAEDGGTEKDGTIELRRGVDDISLGKAKYAQVRIAVDGTHYLKGMALYSDNLPDGVDIMFNTNKHKDTPKMDVLKKLKDDPDNPFGATIKGEEDLKMTQRYYTDKNGKRQLSCINVVNEEGDWNSWSKNLASQFLSKQSPVLAKKQLDLDYAEKKAQLEEINSLTNPTIKKKLLESFANDCDSAAIHLKAAALPGQKTHVILPFSSLKDNEIYAPNYQDGTEVVLVRYPHGGVFEIPRLTVNNRKKEPKSVIGNATDAVGINSKVAEQLSGADFDGDTAVVIPLSAGVKIRTSDRLPGLVNFDPKEAYPYREGMKVMTPRYKQIQMGVVSNLITDMTLKGATDEEIERAVRHSMVVIDAEKHKLDYTQSKKDNNIDELRRIYQDGGGASTIISRAKSEIKVPARKEFYGISSINTDPKTGKRIVTETGEEYVKTKKHKDGTEEKENVKVTQKITAMESVDDAYKLVSSGNYKIEQVYAEYANEMKSLANEARKSYLKTGNLKYSPSARKTYSEEVDSLNNKLKKALSNAPIERQAQLLANRIVDAKLAANPDMDDEHIKKIKGSALTTARARVGASKQRVEITDREWEAIQAGAISENILSSIIDNSDLDSIKKRATPRGADTSLSNAKIALIKSMSSRYTIAEIAERAGVSSSTVTKYLNA